MNMLIEKPARTRTVSFRIPEHIIKGIEKEAKTQLVSTNALINQILLQYENWDKFENRMEMYPIPKESLQHILTNLDELQRGELVDIIYNSIRDWTLIAKKKFDIHSCLEVLENYCRMVGVSVEDTVSSGLHSFIIRHNLGRNASMLICELARKIFWDIVKIKVDTNLTNTTVIVKLQSKFY